MAARKSSSTEQQSSSGEASSPDATEHSPDADGAPDPVEEAVEEPTVSRPPAPPRRRQIAPPKV